MKLSAFLLFFLVFGLTVSRSHSLSQANPSIHNLMKEEKYRIPIAELSGVHLSQDGPNTKIMAIGDSTSKIGVLLTNTKKNSVSHTIDFTQAIKDRFIHCKRFDSYGCSKVLNLLTSDWEALTIDGGENIFILQEFSSNIFVLDKSGETLISTIALDFSPIKKITSKYNANSLGEGMILLKNGRLLVAKESQPAILIEFGPSESTKSRGISTDTVLEPSEQFKKISSKETFYPLNIWHFFPKGKCDISDLAWHQHRLFILSKKCKKIFMKNSPILEKDSSIQPDHYWDLPRKIRKPEALFVTTNHFFIGIDSKKNKKNLYKFRYQLP